MNLREKLIANTEAIELTLKTNSYNIEDKRKLTKYTGFGELKCVLLDTTKPEQFSVEEKKLIPYIERLHKVLLYYSKDQDEYKEYIESLRRSVLTAFYTPPTLINAINHSFTNNNLVFPNVLDPSAGIGAFLRITGNKYTAIEKDLLTGKILKALNPDKDIIIDGFEKIPEKYTGTFNLVVSNIPFGDFKVFDPVFTMDPEKRKSCSSIHTYFFEKGLDMLEDGGLLAFVTSTGVMDSAKNKDFREHLLHRANLITAVRLPQDTFTDTKVLSDFIILQKDEQKIELNDREKQFVERIQEGDIFVNAFYKQNSQNIVSTSSSIGTNLYGKPTIIYKHSGGIKGIAADVEKVISTDIKEHLNIKSTSSVTKQLNLFDDFFGISSESTKRENDNFNFENEIFNSIGSYQIGNNSIGLTISQKEAKIINVNSQQSNIIKLYIELRDSYFLLKSKEESSHTEYPELRQILNDKYESFHTQHGYITDNAKYLVDDIAFPEIRSLELFNNKKFEKADIFKEPIAFSKETEKYTAEEALSVSLNKFNQVNLTYISQLTKLSKNDLIESLKGKIYINPQTYEFEQADIYLSGNVIEKREIAEKEFQLSQNRYIADSIEALTKIIPPKIALEDIGISLGERWIPESFYNDFASKKIGDDIRVKYIPIVDDFTIDGYSNYLAREKYSVRSYNRYYSAKDVFRFALLNNIPDMTRKVQSGSGTINIPDNEGIQEMNAAVSLLQKEFSSWLISLPIDKKNELETIYNQKFNCYVKPQYDGSFQTFPDLNLQGLGIPQLYNSQKDAILRLKNENGGIIDHEVGGGKTLIMCVAAYEMKRLNLVNKPCILGLKANIQEIGRTFQLAYPDAKILYATRNDFTKEKRENFFNKIQNNNWDCIIMTHEQFKSIPQSMDIQKNVINDEIEKIEETIRNLSGGQSNKSLEKGLIKRKENLESKLNSIIYKLNNKKDNIVDFKTMGIDFLFIDESHKFKNLMFQTRHQRVAGLGNSNGSDRALNLLFAIRTIQEKTGKDLGAAFLSGTIISNSLTELYNIFNYLRPKEMMKQNIASFDAWASVYTLKSKDYEFNVTNNIIQKERFRHFVKVPELAMFYSQITDFKTAKDIGVERPSPNEIFVALEQTEQQKEMFKRLKEFAKTGDGTIIYRAPLTDSEDKARMLIATNTAKKAALDMRLIRRDFLDEPTNKVNVAAQKIYDYYKRYNEYKGTQFVFSDTGTYKPGENFNIYTALKEKLIEKGVSAKEIQFVQMASTEKKRTDLFNKMNNGEVRILLGSTEMLGTGVNAQKRCVAIHHFDIPWTPKDLDQRNGRGVRKGNEIARLYANNKVDILIYATKGTLDTYKFNLLKNKALFISQIKNNNIGVRIIDEGAMDKNNGMNYAEYIAILSGNTDLLEKAKLEKTITQLKGEENVFLKQVRDRETKIDHFKKEIISNQKCIHSLNKDFETFLSMPRDDNNHVILDYTFDGRHYNDAKEIGDILNNIVDKKQENENYKKIGTFGPFNLIVKAERYSIDEFEKYSNKLYVEGQLKYTYNNGDVARTAKLAVEYAEKALQKIEGLIVSYKEKNKENKQKIETLENIKLQFLNKPKLEAAISELANINKKINDSLKNKPDIDKEEKTVHRLRR